jgi:CRISPR-associated protein (TIGR03986 family)
MIKAPYRFVPLNKKVVYPDWSEQVSFIAPFKDGVSGEIDVRIVAKTPVFIRDSDDEKKFFNIDGRYMIPGSSLKGVIRTLVEVMSYSKLQTQDRVFSYRDLTRDYLDRVSRGRGVYHGWLKKEGDDWIIQSLGPINLTEQFRIKYNDQEFIRAVGGEEVARKIQQEDRAYKKYRLVNNEILETSRGFIVFTGRGALRRGQRFKTREFLFKKDVQETFKLDKKTIQNFKEAYYIDSNVGSLKSEDWDNLWRKKFENGENVPVFFHIQNGKVAHFGLSYLYKLPFEYSIHDLLKNYQDYREDQPDFAETMFGYVFKEAALKGRVHFGHCEALSPLEHPNEIKVVLSTPRPSFYPFYLEQPEAGAVKNYNNEDAVLAGFKFYPHRPIIERNCQENENVCVTFRPLKVGTIFDGKIRFFNLKPVELGALLSALTFYGQSGYQHKLGMAKPYGFGSVEIKIREFRAAKIEEGETVEDYKRYIDTFVKYMQEQLGEEYPQNVRIQKLLDYHKPGAIPAQDLRYLPVEEFRKFKRPTFNSQRNFNENRTTQTNNNVEHHNDSTERTRQERQRTEEQSDNTRGNGKETKFSNDFAEQLRRFLE